MIRNKYRVYLRTLRAADEKDEKLTQVSSDDGVFKLAHVWHN